MKRILFLLAVAFIWQKDARAVLFFVDYNPAGAAPFHDLQSAIDAAPDGQIIYVYQSTSYGVAAFQQLPDILPSELTDLVLDKPLHIIGMGYFLNENGLLAEPTISVILEHLLVTEGGEGSILEGLTIAHLDLVNTEVEVDRCRLGRITATGGNGSDFTRNYMDDFAASGQPTIKLTGATNFTFDHNYVNAGAGATDVLIIANDASQPTVFEHNIFDGGYITIANASFNKNIFLANTVNVTLGNSYDCNLSTTGLAVPTFDIVHNVLNNPLLLLAGTNLSGLIEANLFQTGGLNDMQWQPADLMPQNIACQLGGGQELPGIYSGSDDEYIASGITVISLNYPVLESTEMPGTVDPGFPLPAMCHTLVLDSIPITHLEFYFDEDPGTGFGLQVPLGGMMSGPCFFSPSLPFANAGLHTLGVRVWNILGRPSNALATDFVLKGPPFAAATLASIEYFLAADYLLDYGNATAAIIDDTDAILSDVLAVDLLPAGVHEIGIRATDENGNFGTTVYRTVLIVDAEADADLPSLNMMEYYFDTDPGYLGGQLLAIPDPTELFCAPVNLGTLDTEENQYHKIFYRIWDDEGNFSITQWRWVYVADNGFLLADLDYNGIVNANDLLLFMAMQGCTNAPEEGCIADFNTDGVINSTDLLLFMSYFGLPGEPPLE